MAKPERAPPLSYVSSPRPFVSPRSARLLTRVVRVQVVPAQPLETVEREARPAHDE